VSERSVQDILSVQGSGDRGEKMRAEDYLRKALAGGPRAAKDVEEEAREAYSISKRTLDRARRELKIPTSKRGNRWCIALPEHEGDLAQYEPPAETAKVAKDARVGTVGNHAKDANAASPGDVGTVGNVDRLRLEDWPAGSEGDGGRAA
jgi:hypothetical protein